MFLGLFMSHTVLYCILLYRTVWYCTVDVKEVLQYMSIMKITKKKRKKKVVSMIFGLFMGHLLYCTVSYCIVLYETVLSMSKKC